MQWLSPLEKIPWMELSNGDSTRNLVDCFSLVRNQDVRRYKPRTSHRHDDIAPRHIEMPWSCIASGRAWCELNSNVDLPLFPGEFLLTPVQTPPPPETLR